jgi:hypothetical protein
LSQRARLTAKEDAGLERVAWLLAVQTGVEVWLATPQLGHADHVPALHI